MYKIHVCRGGFCNILRFSLLQALLVVLFNSLSALLAVIPSRFEYNLAIATGHVQSSCLNFRVKMY